MRGAQEGEEAKEKASFNPLLFLPAAVMHLISRIFSFLSLTFTTVSSFQMLSGCNLIFVCILSRIFLKKSLPWHKWFGVFVIILGVVVVGLADLTGEDDADNRVLVTSLLLWPWCFMLAS